MPHLTRGSTVAASEFVAAIVAGAGTLTLGTRSRAPRPAAVAPGSVATDQVGHRSSGKGGDG